MCVTLLTGDIWKSLEMYLIVTAHGVSAAGIQLVEVRMLLNTLSAEGSGHTKNYWTQDILVLRARNPGLECSSTRSFLKAAFLGSLDRLLLHNCSVVSDSL